MIRTVGHVAVIRKSHTETTLRLEDLETFIRYDSSLHVVDLLNIFFRCIPKPRNKFSASRISC